MKAHNRYFYYFLLVITATYWGSAYPAVRFLVLGGLNPLLVGALRLAVTFLFAVVALACSKENIRFSRFSR